MPSPSHSENGGFLLDHTPGSHEAAEQRLYDELKSQETGGAGIEAPTAAMYRTIRREGPLVKAVLSDAAEMMVRREVEPPAILSGVRTDFVHYFRAKYRQLGQEFNDLHRTKKDDWVEPFEYLRQDLAEDSPVLLEALYYGISALPASTPVFDRTIFETALTHLVSDRWPGGARGLDYGSSVPVGALAAMNQDRHPFSLSEVRIMPQGKKAIDVTEQTNNLFRRPTPFSHIVAVDQFEVYRESTQAYDQLYVERSFSALRPSERNNPEYFKKVEAIKNIKQRGTPEYRPNSGVTFHQADFLDDSEFGQFKEEHPESFDVIMLNCVTQELTPEQLCELHDRLVSRLSHNGLLIYMHQSHLADPDYPGPTSVDRLVQYKDYATHAWRTKWHIHDNLHPTPGIQEMATGFDNRGRKVKLGVGELVVNGALERMSDLIRYSGHSLVA